MDTAPDEDEVLASADPSKREDLGMLAEADELAGEQTWPTKDEEAEMMDAGWEDDDIDMKGQKGQQVEATAGGSKVGR